MSSKKESSTKIIPFPTKKEVVVRFLVREGIQEYVWKDVIFSALTHETLEPLLSLLDEILAEIKA